MITLADKMLSYCSSIGEELQSRLNRIRTFAQHNLSSGTANETILREFLTGHVPTMYSVSEGFVCNPLEENKSSRQCDILIFDQANFPLVYSVGSVVIVLPASTRLVIEVKTNFNKSDIRTALENIESARTLHPGIAGLIFTFKSPSLKTVIKHLTFYTSCYHRMPFLKQ